MPFLYRTVLFLCLFQFAMLAAKDDDRKNPSDKLRDFLASSFDPAIRSQVEGQHNVRFRTLNDAAPAVFKSKVLKADKRYLTMEISSEKDGVGYIEFESGSRRFQLHGDNVYHNYNIDLAAPAPVTGHAVKICFIDQPNTNLRLKRFALSDEPQGKAEIEILSAGLTEAVNYPETEREFFIHVRNHGGTESGELAIAQLSLPPQVKAADGARSLGTVPAAGFRTFRFKVTGSGPVRRPFQLKLSGEGAPRDIFRGTVEIDAKPTQSSADYVPQPKPISVAYELGAFYNPAQPNWKTVHEFSPERKPLLGYYNECDPGTIDWKIKYLVENGITYLLVDWQGEKTQPWIDAYDQARYRNLLKWAVVWNNTASPKETAAQWLDLFKKDYYYKIDGKPVVTILAPEALRQQNPDFLEEATDAARAAGFAGIHFIAVNRKLQQPTEKEIAALKKDGYAMTVARDYHSPGAKLRTTNEYSYDYHQVVEGTYKYFLACQKSYPFLPAISTGYDDFPIMRGCGKSVANRTPEEFLNLCREVKRFADRTGQKRMIFGYSNQWEEGSYIEPNREFGFRMLEAVRSTFGTPGTGSWPVNFAPEAIGLAAPQAEGE